MNGIEPIPLSAETNCADIIPSIQAFSNAVLTEIVSARCDMAVRDLVQANGTDEGIVQLFQLRAETFYHQVSSTETTRQITRGRHYGNVDGHIHVVGGRCVRLRHDKRRKCRPQASNFRVPFPTE